MTAFVDPHFLIEEGPRGFVRQMERLLRHLTFVDLANIDGAGDGGADLIGRAKDDDWVFQCKWKLNGTVHVDAVEQVWSAMRVYGIKTGVVMTTTNFSMKAKERADAL